MSIISSLVAKYPDVVLCEYSDFVGNFQQISRIILQKLNRECKYSMIDYDKYKFFYINENKITYMCLCEGVSSDIAFCFLSEIKKKIFKKYRIDQLNSFNNNHLFAFSKELKILMVIKIFKIKICE